MPSSRRRATRDGTASTGWETFLDAVIRAGFGISGTWPMRTERPECAEIRIATPLPPASSSSAGRERRMRRRRRGGSSWPRSSGSCRRRCGICRRATSPRWTSRRPPSAPAWPSSPATRRCSTRRATRSPCARRWRSSTRRSTPRWPSRRAISIPTAAGRWRGSSSTASTKASSAWPRRSARRRTRA